MMSCIVCGCNDPKATFHKFPSRPSMKKQWIIQCNIKGTIPKYSYVCSSHFTEADYFSTRLRKNAFPTLVEAKISTSTPLSYVSDHSYSTLSRNPMSTLTDSLINMPHSARRPIRRPLDVARMTSKNFSTPKRAEFNLNLIKKKLAEKNKKIKCLTDFNRKLVKNLKEMVEVLDRQNNMLSAQASQILKSYQSLCTKTDQ